MKKLFLTAFLGIIVFSGLGKINAQNVCELDFVKQELQAKFSNEMLTLKSAKCENDTLIYDFAYSAKYSAAIETANAEQKAQNATTVKNMLKSMYCGMPEFEPYRTNNIAIHYNYSTKNFAKFIEVEISNKDCEN
ncbi:MULTISPECIES: hypothetical protein [unclassified Campylobacter]|uniref:hypothetical protein n=1 Tax=unclassified Campylobacter TaxID=2593542 RepID=UPI0022E9D8AD|nr:MULTISPECIES: hypothetical protein [unclassified Campylobacter]MDA3079987.1 hypothetical protein [Campylobacter sp. CS_NA2]MDA3081253.1 hypothetical protein [Campylobacter sp. CS_NA1]MDA3086441.1 hypothetical protein [Campylobacter sp. CS_ED1]MDA3091009.1 hypothetical protein [Campylobacter sp. CS_ED2]WBR51893.1 hypothetical protein PF026_03365 [Campylobacter sp. CS_NA3]